MADLKTNAMPCSSLAIDKTVFQITLPDALSEAGLPASAMDDNGYSGVLNLDSGLIEGNAKTTAIKSYVCTACKESVVPVEDATPMCKSYPCLLYTSPSPRDRQKSRMPSSA